MDAGSLKTMEDEEQEEEGGEEEESKWESGSDKSGADEEGESEDEGAGDSDGEEDAPASEDETEERAPAWVDEDDESVGVDVTASSRLMKLRASRNVKKVKGAEYVERLRAQFTSVQPDTSWANLHTEEEGGEYAERVAHVRFNADESAISRGSGSLLGSRRSLPPETISTRRLADLNQAEACSSVVSAIEWHPNGQLALTAGLDQTLRLFRADGDENPKLQTVHTARMPITSAAFSADGSQIFMCGRAKHWCVFDLNSGSVQRINGVMGRSDTSFRQVLPSPDGNTLALMTEAGALLLLSAKTKQLVATLQPASSKKWTAQALAFSASGDHLYCGADGNQIRVWDVRRRCCVHAWEERGGLRCTSIAASSDGTHVAAGSDSGAVNLYDAGSLLLSPRPEPLHEFLNLRTAVTELRFNPTGEALVMTSKYTRRQLRIAHVASRQVFQNWPTVKTPLGYTQTVNFSPAGGFMAIGNDKGKALLYRLNHYPTS